MEQSAPAARTRSVNAVLVNVRLRAVEEIGNEATAVLDMPLGDTMGLRLVGYRFNQAGHMDVDGHYEQDDANNENTGGVRAKFLWNLSDRVRLVCVTAVQLHSQVALSYPSDLGGPLLGRSPARRSASSSV